MPSPIERSLMLLAALVVFASACSGSVEFSFGGESAGEAAVDLIESEGMAEQLMLDSLTDAACDEPTSDADGTIFLCTAQRGADVVEFEVELEPDDRIFASAVNVVPAAVLGDYANSAVQALNDQNDFTLADDAIDCGTETVVLGADREMTCTLTNPDGTMFGALLTVRDVNTGSFGIEIVEAE